MVYSHEQEREELVKAVWAFFARKRLEVVVIFMRFCKLFLWTALTRLAFNKL